MGSPRLTSSCRGELRGNGGSGCNQTLLGFALEPEQLRAWIFSPQVASTDAKQEVFRSYHWINRIMPRQMAWHCANAAGTLPSKTGFLPKCPGSPKSAHPCGECPAGSAGQGVCRGLDFCQLTTGDWGLLSQNAHLRFNEGVI